MLYSIKYLLPQVSLLGSELWQFLPDQFYFLSTHYSQAALDDVQSKKNIFQDDCYPMILLQMTQLQYDTTPHDWYNHMMRDLFSTAACDTLRNTILRLIV